MSESVGRVVGPSLLHSAPETLFYLVTLSIGWPLSMLKWKHKGQGKRGREATVSHVGNMRSAVSVADAVACRVSCSSLSPALVVLVPSPVFTSIDRIVFIHLTPQMIITCIW